MKSKIAPAAQKIAYFLAAVYFTSYCMRVNLAVMLVKICSELQVEKTELAIVITGLTVAYGIGQVVNGFLCKKYRRKDILFYHQGKAHLCRDRLPRQRVYYVWQGV